MAIRCEVGHPQGASESLHGVKIKTVAPLRVQKKRFQKGNLPSRLRAAFFLSK